ncbi:hypothetical protein MMC29_004291 [Sticta canariensis]|nr:hypothetical protein [Sticta canariensis]
MEGSGENAVSVEVTAVPEKPDFLRQLEDNVEAMAHDLVFLMFNAEAGSPNLQSMTFETMRRSPKGLHKLIAIAVFNSMARAVRHASPMGRVVYEAFQIARNAVLGAEGVNLESPLALPASQAMVSLGVLAILTPSILPELGFPARPEPGAFEGTWAGSWVEKFGQTVHVHHLCLYLSNLRKFYKGPDPSYLLRARRWQATHPTNPFFRPTLT